MTRPYKNLHINAQTFIATTEHGLSNGDVWHSADHGETWQQLPFNLTGIHRTLIMLV